VKNNPDEQQRLRRFDYAICAYGAIGAIVMLGVFGDVPTLLRFLIGLFSIAICLLSLATLVVKNFTGYFTAVERRANYLYLFFNVVPSVAWVFQLMDKTQIPTPPGCC
jgi:hypothetical protein